MKNTHTEKADQNQALEQALLARDAANISPTSLISYQSNGRLIIIGQESQLAFCRDFSEPLKLSLVCTDRALNNTAHKNQTSSIPVIQLNNRNIKVEGHLGNFNVKFTANSGAVEQLTADLILDLQTTASIKLEVPPPGYLHSSLNAENWRDIQDQLIDMTGAFEKPKYFNYQPSICAHGVNGKTVCTQCIDACPAGAISSLVEKISVDPFLCQGGGTCATVCPSGAIQYVYPTLADSGNQIRLMLKAYREFEGQDAVVVFHADDQFDSARFQQHNNLLPIQVEEVASVGMDLCLSAIAYGANQVVLLANDDMPKLSQDKVFDQINWMQAILTGFGLDALSVSLQITHKKIPPLTQSQSIEPALYSMPKDKREAVFQAIDHFYLEAEKKSEMIDLEVGAPFGLAAINSSTCTLCMACVSACPGNALQDGSGKEVPEISFIESHCIQCGTCTQTCPEQAITISPRMIFNREKRNQPSLLMQDSPFGCITCGKPFATSSVIQKMNSKLKDHYMFKTSRALDRLKMCEDCRVADIVQDPEAIGGNFDPQNSPTGRPLS